MALIALTARAMQRLRLCLVLSAAPLLCRWQQEQTSTQLQGTGVPLVQHRDLRVGILEHCCLGSHQAAPDQTLRCEGPAHSAAVRFTHHVSDSTTKAH